MAQNPEHLNKLLEFIKLVIRDNGNKKFTEELRKALQVGPSASASLSDDRYEQLSELCVEKVITEQGKQFYKEFPIKEIVPKLVEDFVRMESFKRRDNFEDFCLAAYQQVEAIVNWFCSQVWFENRYQKDYDKVFYTKKSGGEVSYGKHILNTNDISKQRGAQLSSLFFNMRLRAVLHYVYYDSCNVYNRFNEKFNSINELYLCRNLNHRGGESSEYQKERINQIYPKRYLYYLGFTGVLFDFVTKITENYKIFEEQSCEHSVRILALHLHLKSEDRLRMQILFNRNTLKMVIDTTTKIQVIKNSMNQYCIKDLCGNILVPYGVYGWVDHFNQGYARVKTFLGSPRVRKVNGRKVFEHPQYGIINSAGEIVIPMEYDVIQPLKNGYNTMVMYNEKKEPKPSESMFDNLRTYGGRPPKGSAYFDVRDGNIYSTSRGRTGIVRRTTDEDIEHQ